MILFCPLLAVFSWLCARKAVYLNHMPLIQLIVLAIIQGITEFLPVSSSAHLILVPLAVNGWSDQGPLIDIAAHVGSLGAVLLYFRTETASLFRGGVDALRFRESPDRRLFLFIAGATVPILIAASIFVALDLTAALRSPVIIGWASILFGVLLWHGDRAPQQDVPLERLTWRVTIAIGLAQALALIPGASRSGITMTAARYFGWSRTAAARFSMLLAIPTILAFGAFAGIKIIREGAGANASAAAIVAILSFVVAYGTIAAFLRLTRSVSFTPFVLYRVALGVGILYIAAGFGGVG